MKILYTFKLILKILFTKRKNRLGLLSAFIKLKFAGKLNKSNTVKEINIFGYKISYSNFNELNSLFIEIFINEEYEFNSEKQDIIIIDAGTNIGLSLIYFFLNFPNAEVLAFEPDKSNFELLEMNIGNNFLNAKAYNKALYSEKTEIEFFTSKSDFGSVNSSLFETETLSQQYRINAVPLSDYIISEIDFLKIDTEGAEGIILKELSESNRINMINNMIIEYHSKINTGGNDLSEIINILNNNGFCFNISSKSRNPNHSELEEFIHVWKE